MNGVVLKYMGEKNKNICELYFLLQLNDLLKPAICTKWQKMLSFQMGFASNTIILIFIVLE